MFIFPLLYYLQARILALNASYFLKAGGHFVISIKVLSSIYKTVDFLLVKKIQTLIIPVIN